MEQATGTSAYGVPAMIPQLARELRAAIDCRVAALGLTGQQSALIGWIALGETSPSRLAQRLCTDTAGITRLLDRLEEKGLLRRARRPGDRRAVVVELTEAGQAMRPRLLPVLDEVGAQLLAGFSEVEQQRAAELLRRMLGNLLSDPATR